MATVIRRGASQPEAADHAGLAAFTFSDMSVQGDEYVKRIQAEAAKIIQEAKAEAESIRQQAEKEGLATADASISEMLDQRVGGQMETLRPALDQVVAEIQKSHGAWLEHWRSAALTLSTAIAERIVRRELTTDPTVSEQWLAEALKLAAGSSDLTIRLSPNDFDHLKEHAEGLIDSLGGVGEANFVADGAISDGGCVVETRHGRIDQQLETQLERLAEELE